MDTPPAVPDSSMRLLLLLIDPIVVPPSLKIILAPSASSVMSPAESNVIGFAASVTPVVPS